VRLIGRGRGEKKKKKKEEKKRERTMLVEFRTIPVFYLEGWKYEKGEKREEKRHAGVSAARGVSVFPL